MTGQVPDRCRWNRVIKAQGMQAVDLNPAPVTPAYSFLPQSRPVSKTILTFALFAIIAVHVALLLTLQPHAAFASRLCTATAAALAALCASWRARRLPSSERFALQWVTLSVLLWATAHALEAFIGTSAAASNLTVDPSDFIYVTAAFPLLLALASTRESASVRAVFYLNGAQIVMALLLTYFRLYRMTMTPHAAATVMGKIYAVDCVLLLILVGLRSFARGTREEGRTFGLILTFLLAYVPIELGMDYGSAVWRLHEGTLLDMLWSIPFVIVAWRTLRMPIDATPEGNTRTTNKGRLMAEILCPMLISIGVFALAASIASEHLTLSLAVIFLLIVIQGVQAGLLQVSYLNGQLLLIEREQDLRTANAALEQLSMLDPLTCVANRRRLDAALDAAWRRGMRKAQPVSLLIIDVDFFKEINDHYGHGYGDECLVLLAREIERHAGRPDDLLARYGGDEFFLLLPGTDRRGARAVADGIQAAVRRLGLTNHASPLSGKVTLSIGAGTAKPAPGTKPAALVNAADEAVYEAKRLGRDQTCAPPLESIQPQEAELTTSA